MPFPRVRPESRWLTGTTLETAELEAIDENLYRSINGDQGGAWSPTARLVVGGAGLHVGRAADLADVRRIKMAGDALVTFGGVGKAVDHYQDIAGGYVPLWPDASGEPGWRYTAQSTRPLWASVKLGAPLILSVRPPRNTVVSAITATFGSVSVTTHVAAPDKLTSFEFLRSLILDPSAFEVLGSVTDVYVDQPSYAAPHDLTLTIEQPHAIDPKYNYWLRAHAESGENALGLNVLSAIRVTGRIRTLDPHRA
jgi:hypothetical protein